MSKGRSPCTYLEQVVGKRSGRFEMNMIEALLKHVSWQEDCSVLYPDLSAIITNSVSLLFFLFRSVIREGKIWIRDTG